VFALLGTGFLLGGVVLVGFLALSALRPAANSGVIVATHDGQKPQQNLVFCPPVTDSTGAYQYIPVGAVVAEDSDRDPMVRMDSFAAKHNYFGDCAIEGYGGARRIFNVVVRDLKSGDQHLLLDKTSQIEGLRVPEDKCSSGEGRSPCGFILWEIRTQDTNKDGKINRDDVLTAYISDLSALSLRPMTPPEATLLASQWTPVAKAWHFQIRRDANNDGHFTDEDGSELLEAKVLADATSQPVIDETVLTRLKEAVK
jgi:hypothetical protein